MYYLSKAIFERFGGGQHRRRIFSGSLRGLLHYSSRRKYVPSQSSFIPFLKRSSPVARTGPSRQWLITGVVLSAAVFLSHRRGIKSIANVTDENCALHGRALRWARRLGRFL